MNPADMSEALESASEGLGVLDMNRCALFVYIDLDGNAIANAEHISKRQAAEWLRLIAQSWETEEPAS